MKHVVISVCGGWASIAYVSEGVSVKIVDLDNLGSIVGEKQLERIIRHAKVQELAVNMINPSICLDCGDVYDRPAGMTLLSYCHNCGRKRVTDA